MSSFMYNALTDTPLPVQLIHIPQALAVWIDAVAPCVVGAQSYETYKAIFGHLAARGVDRATIDKAFSFSKNTWRMGLTVRLADLSALETPHQQMSAVTNFDPKIQADMIADNFRIAQNMDDVAKMKQLLRAFQSLLEQRNVDQLEMLQKDATVRILWPYVRIGADGSVTIFENLVEFDAAEARGEGEAAP
jgi:hypothetical protein